MLASSRIPIDLIPDDPLRLPGWYIEGHSRGREVWVFGNDTLHRFLPHEPRRLPDSDLALLYDSLAIYTRSFRA
jgi:hypothetical protein